MNLYCFDFFGVPVGYIDDHGELFDDQGVHWGALRGREVYDLDGHYRGRFSAQGSFIPATGRCRWYVRDPEWLNVQRLSVHLLPVRANGPAAER
jgi:hypothetical protein